MDLGGTLEPVQMWLGTKNVRTIPNHNMKPTIQSTMKFLILNRKFLTMANAQDQGSF